MKKTDIKKLCMGCMKEKPSASCVCPHCGFDAAFYHTPEALPLGRKLQNKYTIGKEIGHGGFGKTYIAYDELLGVLCVKELFPDRAYRDNNSCDIVPRAGFENDFDRLRENAYEEARRLANFRNLPGIVKVYDCFEENNTSYIVMEYVDGINLNEYLDKKGKMTIEAVLAKLKPVMESLSEMHKEGLIHRDIAPDNLMLKDDGTLVLIDFGSARNFSASMSRSLTKTLKSGYSPIEQYSGSNQGPWTDIYELCATIYALVTGKIAPDATERVSEDNLRLSVITSEQLQRTLKTGLALDYKERYQTIDELYRALYGAPSGRRIRANNLSGIKKILVATACFALLGGLIALPQLQHRNLPEMRTEKQQETNTVETKAEQQMVLKSVKPKPVQAEITVKDKVTVKDIKSKEITAKEKPQNNGNKDGKKTENKGTKNIVPNNIAPKKEEFYKRPVHTATEKYPYTLSEMRWIFKTEEMLKYMYPKLSSTHAHMKYQELMHEVNACYNEEGGFWADGDDYSIIQKAKSDVQKEEDKIKKEADKTIEMWNSIR